MIILTTSNHALIQKIVKKLRDHQDQHYKQYNWLINARSQQLPPSGNWKTWLILAGRGFGKTRTGAETIRSWVSQGIAWHIALIGKTKHEARKIMLEGPSGLLTIFPPSERPSYNTTTQCLTFNNGSKAYLFGGDSYESLRGPQFDTVWIDEIAKFKYPQEVWDQTMMSLRLGQNPRCIITTTPKPIPLLHTLLDLKDVIVTRGTTFDNQSNLSASFIQTMNQRYEHTTLGMQELYAQILDKNAGALWTSNMILRKEIDSHQLKRIVIAIDPATTSHQKSDETGIIVAGIDDQHHGFILDDISGRYTPNEWGKKALEAYWHWKADRIIAEVNNGGDLVDHVIKSLDDRASYKAVRATRGKITRAEPIASLYEQGRIFHTKIFTDLEHQLCHYSQGSSSPDRMDALVWALTELFLEKNNSSHFKVWTHENC